MLPSDSRYTRWDFTGKCLFDMIHEHRCSQR